MKGLQSLDLAGLSDKLISLLRDPTSNLSAALVLYGILALLVLILLVAGIVLLMGTPDDEVEPETEAESAEPDSDESTPNWEVLAAPAAQATVAPKLPRSPAVTIAVVAAIIAGVWVVSGFTMSANEVCIACHTTTVHTASKSGSDPHKPTACVSCHESGGGVGRYVTNVPTRVLHFVDGATKSSLQPGYGGVSTGACLACHTKDVVGVNLNKVTGVRVSHKEPLAASARCLDCHVLSDGSVSRRTVGMSSCLRCHNSVTASSSCVTCHDKKAAAAAIASSTSLVKVQIPNVTCGGCHDQKKQCDSCHGLRMPHTLAFKASHARAAAVDFWFNGGRTCSGCHTATRRPCTQCHSPLLGHAHPISLATEHQKAAPEACDRCHQVLAVPRSRNFCTAVCHTAAARLQSPR